MYINVITKHKSKDNFHFDDFYFFNLNYFITEICEGNIITNLKFCMKLY